MIPLVVDISVETELTIEIFLEMNVVGVDVCASTPIELICTY